MADLKNFFKSWRSRHQNYRVLKKSKYSRNHKMGNPNYLTHC